MQSEINLKVRLCKISYSIRVLIFLTFMAKGLTQLLKIGKDETALPFSMKLLAIRSYLNGDSLSLLRFKKKESKDAFYGLCTFF